MKRVALLIVVLFIIGVSASCSSTDVVLIKSESYYSDFEVTNDTVNITCHVTLKNNLDKEQTITLSAEFPDDVGTLLKSSPIESEHDITLMPRAKESYEVTFVGEFAGVNQKHDRLLPTINIVLK